jgi:hypothetical protein
MTVASWRVIMTTVAAGCYRSPLPVGSIFGHTVQRLRPRSRHSRCLPVETGILSSRLGRAASRHLSDFGLGRMVVAVKTRTTLVAGALIIGLVLTSCSSGSTSPSAGATSSPTTAASATTAQPGSTSAAAVPTTAAATTGAAICPTLAQANSALGGSYSGPIQTATPGGGIVCEYTSASGTAGVTIFAHQSATVFAGQVAHAPGAPAMPQLSGVGDGAFGQTTGGRSIVNAYSNSSRTLVAAQASGPLASVEALARVALSDN